MKARYVVWSNTFEAFSRPSRKSEPKVVAKLYDVVLY